MSGARFLASWHLRAWRERKQTQLKRGRSYKKDYNARVEQKDWTHVRKLLGGDGYDSAEAVEALNDLYRHPPEAGTCG